MISKHKENSFKDIYENIFLIIIILFLSFVFISFSFVAFLGFSFVALFFFYKDYFFKNDNLELKQFDNSIRLNVLHKNIIYSETDLKGNITFVSDKFCEISGFSKEELIGKPHNIVRHPDTPKEVFYEIWKTIKSGKEWTGIVKNKNKQGKSYYVKASIFPKFFQGQIIGFASSREDITEFILKEEIEKKIYDSLNTIIFKINKNGISFNKNFLDTFGFSSTEDFSKKHSCLGELFSFEKNKDYINPISEKNKPGFWKDIVINNQNTNKISKIAMIDINGNKKVYKVKYVDLSNFNLNAEKEIYTFIDITELEQQKDILQEKTKFSTMGEMIGMIAHQWRQPLASLNSLFVPLQIKQQMGIIVEPKDFDEKIQRQGEIIKYLNDTIEVFLSFSQKETFSTEVSIGEIIYKPYRIIEQSLNNQHIDFQVNFLDGLDKEEQIVTNQSKCDQVLLNLYKNSLDEFKSKKIDKPFIKINVYKENKNIIFEVFDNAGGIPVDIIDNVFDAYFSTKSKNGHGLGLYMTKTIVENHLEGSIEVFNINDEAHFKISLPIFLI